MSHKLMVLMQYFIHLFIYLFSCEEEHSLKTKLLLDLKFQILMILDQGEDG